MIDKKNMYALVGASNNPEKFGYKILKDLLDAGYKVLPINPREQEILGQRVYPTLSSVEQKIDVVISVVPPTVTEMLVDEIKILGIQNIWMQPGSENDVAIQKCLENGINCVHNACIMLEKNHAEKV